MNMNDTMSMMYYSTMNSEMDMGNDTMTMTMQMYFTWDTNVTVLFSWWDTQGNTLYYFLTLLILFIISISFEVCSVIFGKYGKTDKEALSTVSKLLYSLRTSTLYTIRFIIAYILMLSIMTYNWGIAIVIFAGIFIGKTIFVFFGYDDSYTNLEVGCH